MAHDVFISHSSKDKTIADAVCAGLEKKGIKCWIAPRNINPGQEWAEAIVKAVKSSRAMVLVFSDNANHSKDVAKEILLAINSDIEILPLKIEAAEPKDTMQYYLADCTWLDAAEKPLKEIMQDLLDVIRPVVLEEPVGTEETPDIKFEEQTALKKRFDPAAFIREKKKIIFPATGMAALTVIGLLFFLLIPRSEPALIKSVHAGGNHSFILMENGDLYAFGNNIWGQLGLGEEELYSIPRKLDGFGPVRAVSAGDMHSLFLLKEGIVFSSGFNYFGQLGLGGRENRLIPEQIPGLEEVKALSAGETHSLTLSESGEIFSFGLRTDGQLGDSFYKVEEAALKLESMISPPLIIESLIGKNVKEISAGYRFSLVLLENGEVYSFGNGNRGQLGHGDSETKMKPEKIESITEAVAIATGNNHSLVLLENGELYSFGRGAEGQLGHGNRETVLFPIIVEFPGNIKAIAAGEKHSLILTEEGHVYSFGSGANGVLGHGDQEDRLVPTRIEALENVRAIAAGRTHSIVLTEEDLVLLFGRNQSGQLGLGDSENRLAPAAVETPWLIEE
jgi:alpha-tubulin suppressor-like RCC1 family protein